MALQLEVPYKGSFTTKKSPDAVFAYLTDYEKCLKDCFAGILTLERKAGGAQLWTFEKINYGSYALQIRVLTKVEEFKPHEIRMSPMKEPGASTLSGGWKITGENPTNVELALTLHTELPLPTFLKSMAAPLANKELSKLFDRYVQNVAKALS